MSQIPSPYNFVAVENRVASAQTPSQISHDIPFQDGMSGWLVLEVEATTPIYTRAAGDFRDYRANGFVNDCAAIVDRAHSQDDIGDQWRNRKDFKSFTDFYRLPDGRPAIPGTSLRGVIRNLLEMVTNSRLGPVNERRYAVRDLNNNDRNLYGGWMTSNSSGVFEPRVHAGWLRANGDQWAIAPCEFARVEQTVLGTHVGNTNLLGGRGGLKRKYDAWSGAGQSLAMNWKIDPLKVHKHSGGKQLRYRVATPLTSGGIPGTLVFTGQPMDRIDRRKGTQPPGRKHLEFVFFNPSSDPIPISAKARKDFLETHTDEQGVASDSWAYWKGKLAGGVPVFYLAYPSVDQALPDSPTVSLNQRGAHLHAFGLAMMFRLAYRHTLREAIPATHRADPPKDQPDFTEALFGYQREVKDEGRGGRVAFGPCVGSETVRQLPPVVTVLGSPKPTYYPNYLEQSFDPNNGHKLAPGKSYATLMDPEAQRRLRGWKFYPAHRDGQVPSPNLPPKDRNRQRNYKTATAFRPLAAGTVFKGRIRFHNLRPVELGALAWALTWGNDPEKRHRLGMAKSLGYGCAKIALLEGKIIPNQTEHPIVTWNKNDAQPRQMVDALEAFETHFKERLLSPDIQDDLLGMADQNHGQELRYPSLQKPNEFADAKKAKLVLPRWRVLAGKDPGNSVVDKDDLQNTASSSTKINSSFAEKTVHKCEVKKKKESKRKATLQIVGGKTIDTGGLDPAAKERYEEIPEIGDFIEMKIVKAGNVAGSYLFTFPD